MILNSILLVKKDISIVKAYIYILKDLFFIINKINNLKYIYYIISLIINNYILLLKFKLKCKIYIIFYICF